MTTIPFIACFFVLMFINTLMIALMFATFDD